MNLARIPPTFYHVVAREGWVSSPHKKYPSTWLYFLLPFMPVTLLKLSIKTGCQKLFFSNIPQSYFTNLFKCCNWKSFTKLKYTNNKIFHLRFKSCLFSKVISLMSNLTFLVHFQTYLRRYLHVKVQKWALKIFNMKFILFQKYVNFLSKSTWS